MAETSERQWNKEKYSLSKVCKPENLLTHFSPDLVLWFAEKTTGEVLKLKWYLFFRTRKRAAEFRI